jgi:hypothetical protein
MNGKTKKKVNYDNDENDDDNEDILSGESIEESRNVN